MQPEQLLLEALRQPLPAIAYFVSSELAQSYPGWHLLEGDEQDFDVDQFAADGHCQITVRAGVHPQFQTGWDDGAPYRGTMAAWYQVQWREQSFEVLLARWNDGRCSTHYYWLLADTADAARAFFSAVCAWNTEIRGEVLVFSGGYWDKDAELYRSIQGATFENLVLAGDLKQEIRADLDQFFAARPMYEEYGIPWKRGVLLVGPPGNGKTHTVKALLNHVEKPCLYVKSFKAQYSTDHDNIRAVFKRAREATPCVLVLEDLDSLVDSDNRSYFLNELDGFAANTGILTLATTNHPERLDPAILDRPSRFDRKYHFELPTHAERAAYLRLWNGQFQPSLRLNDEELARLAGTTEEFSFAYLKELVLSSLMGWISTGRAQALATVMEEQTRALREQMSSVEEEVTLNVEAESMAAAMKQMRAMRGRGWRGGG